MATQTKIMDFLKDIPRPDGHEIKFVLIGDNVYSEEEDIETFVKEEKSVKKPIKLGKLNQGFTFFDAESYSTRLVVKNRKVQGIELYVPKDQDLPALKVDVPIIQEDRFTKKGEMDVLINAFQIPESLPDDAVDAEPEQAE